VGVYAGDQWTCHACHAATEFFADFGTYAVEHAKGGVSSLTLYQGRSATDFARSGAQ